MDKDKVLKLAELSRIEIKGEEAEGLSHEFDSILGYVSEVKKAVGSDLASGVADFPTKNVMRADNESHEPGIYTEALLSQAPEREGNYLKVKKIL